MESIPRPSNTCSGSTEDTAFIQCVDGQETHIHELWCLGLDNLTCNVHSTARVDFTAGTVREFVTDYFAENRFRTQIIGQLSMNNSVHFWGVTAQL